MPTSLHRVMLAVDLSILFVVLTASPVDAATIWNVTYLDVNTNTNVGFDDPTFGATRRATLESVFGNINTIIAENGTVDFEIKASQTDAGGFLASAGPFYFSGPNGFANGFVFDHATTGVDPTGSVPDATATFDFGYNWNSGTGSPTGAQFDLYSVALHEITHAMGFLSLVNSSGQSEISNSDPGVYSVYDSFLERGNGTALFGAGGDFIGTTGDLTSNDVYFDGPNARAGNGGSPVRVYAPGSYAEGSSISHITGNPDFVMNFSVAPGVERREYTLAEIGILQDIGWSIVPEPSTYAMGIIGSIAFAALGWRLRRSGPAFAR